MIDKVEPKPVQTNVILWLLVYFLIILPLMWLNGAPIEISLGTFLIGTAVVYFGTILFTES